MCTRRLISFLHDVWFQYHVTIGRTSMSACVVQWWVHVCLWNTHVCYMFDPGHVQRWLLKQAWLCPHYLSYKHVLSVQSDYLYSYILCEVQDYLLLAILSSADIATPNLVSVAMRVCMCFCLMTVLLNPLQNDYLSKVVLCVNTDCYASMHGDNKYHITMRM